MGARWPNMLGQPGSLNTLDVSDIGIDSKVSTRLTRGISKMFKKEPDRPKYFEYTPLDRTDQVIRLLVLLPGSGTSTVRCMIEHVPLAEAPPYNAMSYTWDASHSTRRIELNGARFLIGSNLYHFLERLRSPTQRRALWVDAICINQTSDADKNIQVRMMGEICRAAVQVQVWLGDGADGSD